MSTKVLAAVAVTTALTLTACTDSPPDDATATGTATSPAVDCGPPPAADVTSPEGWIGYLAEHPDSVGLVIDDGHGNVVAHRADDPQPLASAVKVVHLAAYARAVADGTLDPAEQIPVAEWERWYLPDTDGGAHPAAMQRLGVTPEGTVALDDLVTAMIQESDNAAPDYLRDRLGDDALTAAAEQGGWDDFAPPTMLGNTLGFIAPEDTDADLWDTAQRYANDPGFRAEIHELLQQPDVLPDDPYGEMDRIQRDDNAGTAEQLASIHRAIADGSFGSGADIARGHLEWQPAPPGTEGLGFKGGSLPGILTEAMSLRLADGTVATAVILTSNMTEADYTAARGSFAHQGLMFAAMTEPEIFDRIRCAV
ncbi:class A beta-lactamase-related serine hydrolase [Rhodococcus sp. F64268]|uniref:serine hydrolase n=1 Tax=Rhodococcus sp. F64268 TaxID=2926402 RepID=UPI001FF1694F|nr:serine hydrolase [Rhodococcus sp. F64268]MCK0089258.1 class A beta-lactamase-related serine hydrolase [Rhodococcus sp. F64268]